MKSVLIIGSPNSLHTVNFITSVIINNRLAEHVALFSVDHDRDMKKEYEDFYQENHIRIIHADTVVKKFKQLRRIDYILRKTAALSALLRNTCYDYCFILYCSEYNAMWGGLFSRHFKKLIPVFWGGDVLRNNRLCDPAFQRMFHASYSIVLPNLNSMKVFHEKTNARYRDKTVVIQYPQKMIPALESAETLSASECRQKFGLPEDKKIVICGHTATRAENYVEVIRSLNQCPDAVLKDCYFVFMMTYAPEEYHSYQEEVSRALEDSRLDGVIFKDFIVYEDILKLHYASDIHITAIKTDALSCFLQEELFSGSILLYGKWLNYYELENDSFSVVPFDTIEHLGETFTDVMEHYAEMKREAKCNRTGIIHLASEESILREWNQKVFATGGH